MRDNNNAINVTVNVDHPGSGGNPGQAEITPIVFVLTVLLIWGIFKPGAFIAFCFILSAWFFHRAYVVARERREVKRQARLEEQNKIAMRAEYQDRMHQQGDPIGTYGEYDGYTMPMTERTTPIYDNYDDGLHEWR